MSDCHVLRDGNSSVTIDAFGATVVDFEVHGRKVLFLSPFADRTGGKAIRGGIPICWPWFGSHPTREKAPSHGLARTRTWAWSRRGPRHAQLTLVDDDSTTAWWPAFRLTLDVRLEDDTLTLRLTHHTDEPVEVTAALHTYLRMDAATTRVRGLLGCEAYDKLTQTSIPSVEEPTFDDPIDRIHVDVPGSVHVHDGTRSVEVEHPDGPDIVVWNPGADQAARMPDLRDAASFVCVEAARIRPIRVTPSEPFVLTTVIRPC